MVMVTGNVGTSSNGIVGGNVDVVVTDSGVVRVDSDGSHVGFDGGHAGLDGGHAGFDGGHADLMVAMLVLMMAMLVLMVAVLVLMVAMLVLLVAMLLLLVAMLVLVVMVFSPLYFVLCGKTLRPKATWGGRTYFILYFQGTQSIIVGSQSRNSRQELGAETIRKHWLLVSAHAHIRAPFLHSPDSAA